MIDGFRETWAQEIQEKRCPHFANFHALETAALPRPALEHLAEADALRSINLPRRLALWRIAGLETAPPLFAGQPRRHLTPDLPIMTTGEHVVADYRTTGLSLRAHPCALLRNKLTTAGALTCAGATTQRDGKRLRLGGIVTVRQRPGTAKGTVFITIEDETGIANIVVWPSMVETFRNQILGASLLIIEGRLQRSEEGVIHIIAERLADRTNWIAGLDTPLAHADEWPHARPPRHPRQERVVRKSRDFH